MSLQIFAFISKVLSDPNLQTAVTALIAFIQSLSESQQAAYLSKFDPAGGYGCSGDPDCPFCPDEAAPAEDALIEALSGG